MANRSSSTSASAKSAKSAKNGKSGQGGRKRTPPPKPPRHISWGVVAASALVAIFAGGIIAYAALNGTGADKLSTAKGNPAKAKLTTSKPPWAVPANEADYVAKAGVPINPPSESFHIHAHLDVYNNGKQIPVPANLGFDQAKQVGSSLHTHDTTGVLHMENDKPYTYHLGQIFTEWGVSLSSSRVGGLVASGGAPLKFYVDGKAFTGDPSQIELGAHQEVAVVYGTPPATIPPKYAFPQGE